VRSYPTRRAQGITTRAPSPSVTSRKRRWWCAYLAATSSRVRRTTTFCVRRATSGGSPSTRSPGAPMLTMAVLTMVALTMAVRTRPGERSHRAARPRRCATSAPHRCRRLLPWHYLLRHYLLAHYLLWHFLLWHYLLQAPRLERTLSPALTLTLTLTLTLILTVTGPRARAFRHECISRRPRPPRGERSPQP
jgi:hypothetical protein